MRPQTFSLQDAWNGPVEKLIAWKTRPCRKPLALNGMRQVGKTWLLGVFYRTQFKNVAIPRTGQDEEYSAIRDDEYGTLG